MPAGAELRERVAGVGGARLEQLVPALCLLRGRTHGQSRMGGQKGRAQQQRRREL